MFAILAEAASDFETLKQIVWKICDDKSVRVVGKGFSSGSELLKNGARDLTALALLPNVRTIFVCHDADDLNCADKREEVKEKVIDRASLNAKSAVIVVPVSMIEAWILADVNACRSVFKALGVQKEILNPEGIRHAKEHLERLCRERSTVPRYSNATHNRLIAPYLDLKKVYKRCASFREFAHSVDSTKKIQRPPDFWKA